MSGAPADRGIRPALSSAKEIATRGLAHVPGLYAADRLERGRRRRVLQHTAGGRTVNAVGVLVADKPPREQDLAIAERLLRAFRAATETGEHAQDPARDDLWTIIAAQQAHFAAVLERGEVEELARYLCNVSRHDATIGISQGEHEYARIARDRAYRSFLARMTKDKLVSLAEAVGALPLENPEQGAFGVNLQIDADELIAGIAARIGIDITPPDIDGGLFKLRTSGGLFGERDANAIFTAWLLKRVAHRWEAPRVCEIGAGTGRVAHWSRQLGLRSHTIIDLPHVNVVQGYYLLKTAPASAVLLYGEDSPAGAPELTIWPSHAIAQLPDPEYEIVLNQDSMPEMSSSTVEDYLRWIARVCRGLFVSINHESRPAYGENLTHVSVPEAVSSIGGFELVDRYPYWLRKGYVVELYQGR